MGTIDFRTLRGDLGSKMEAFKIVAGIALVFLLGGVTWAVLHLRKIKRTLIADEAMPKSAPGSNILVLLITVMLVFSSLLFYLVFFK